MLKVNRYKHVTEETNLVSIPSLIKRGFRTSLLVDGSYRHKDGPGRYVEMRKEDVTIEQMNQVTEVAAWFTVGTQGQKPKKAAGNKELMHSLSEYLLEYNGTPFPGKINKVLAIKGSKVYKNQCASCHGDYSKGIQDIELLSFPNTFVHVDVIKTDRVRIDIEDVDKIIDAFNKTKFADFIEGQSNKGYVAPILSGLWATAPYLHNGSVPTLWHLMNPNTRPSKFPVGGHNIDFDKVGVSYKLIKGKNDYDYIPWSQKDVYDINKKGHGNQGHEFPFNKMSPSEKMELIEYLKLI